MSFAGQYTLGLIINPIETITGNVGGAVSADLATRNVTIVGTNPITVTGTPLTNTLTITVLHATEIQAGVLETATDAETIAGLVTDVAVVPSSLKAKLGAQTDHNLIIGAGVTAPLGTVASGTNGQVLLGSTGLSPAFASLTSAGGTITFTPGVNSLNLEAAGSSLQFDADAGSATSVGGIIQILGGTDINTTGAGNAITISLDAFTDHSVLVGSGANPITPLL